MPDDNPHNAAASSDRALIVSPNPNAVRKQRMILMNDHWKVVACENFDEFLTRADEGSWPLVLVTEKAGCDLAENILEKLRPEIKADRTQVTVFSETPSVGDTAFCIKRGAAHYRPWPVLPSEILEIAARARRQIHYEADADDHERTPSINDSGKSSEYREMIGTSRPLTDLMEKLVKIAESHNLSAFITGETGVGKEVVARQIHQLSERSGHLCAINCAAMAESLLESELFGHEKGAFTGAHAVKKSLWEEAAHGTLFLDEITEASPALQAKLLRVLQEGTIRRVGSNQETKVTARVIAASNRNIEKAIADGSFREDLFYRFDEVVHVPSLRERIEDIPLLVEHFCRRAGKGTIFTPDAMALLCRHKWPGNVRELERAVNKLTTYCGRRIFPDDVHRHAPLPDESGTRPADDRTKLFLSALLNATRRGGWPSMQQIRATYVIEVYHQLGQTYPVAKALRMDYRTVNAILKEELGLSESNGDVAQSGDLFADELEGA
ncbi:MAG: sigma-54-dependent transcriptional regulator [Blastocatellia bacterium]